MNGHTLLIIVGISVYFISLSEQVRQRRRRICDRVIRRAARDPERRGQNCFEGMNDRKRRHQYQHPAHKHGFLHSFDDVLPPWNLNVDLDVPGVKKNPPPTTTVPPVPNGFLKVPPRIKKEDRLEMAAPRVLPLKRPPVPFRNPEAAMYVRSPKGNDALPHHHPILFLNLSTLQVGILTLVLLVL